MWFIKLHSLLKQICIKMCKYLTFQNLYFQLVYIMPVTLVPSFKGKRKQESHNLVHLLWVPQIVFLLILLHNVHLWDSLCKFLGKYLDIWTFWVKVRYFFFLIYCVCDILHIASFGQVNLIFIILYIVQICDDIH